MSMSVVMFCVVHTQPGIPTASFGVFPGDKAGTEALAEGSQGAVRLLSLAGSECRELSAVWETTPRKSAGNRI